MYEITGLTHWPGLASCDIGLFIDARLEGIFRLRDLHIDFVEMGLGGIDGVALFCDTIFFQGFALKNFKVAGNIIGVGFQPIDMLLKALGQF